MKKGYVAICAYTAEYGSVQFEFVECFPSKKSAIDYLAASIGREWESIDCSTRNERAIEKSVDELNRCGETRKDCGDGNQYVWKLVEMGEYAESENAEGKVKYAVTRRKTLKCGKRKCHMKVSVGKLA